jgi:hypothetical protein
MTDIQQAQADAVTALCRDTVTFRGVSRLANVNFDAEEQNDPRLPAVSRQQASTIMMPWFTNPPHSGEVITDADGFKHTIKQVKLRGKISVLMHCEVSS